MDDKQAEAAPPQEGVKPARKYKIKQFQLLSDKIGHWYVQQVLLSDYTYAWFWTAMLETLRIYFHMSWESLFNNLLLFYLMFLSIIISKVARRYYRGQYQK